MAFNSHKRSDTQPDVVQYGVSSSALRSFNQTLLFQSAMIHLNAPRRFGKAFAFRLAHRVETRRPVLRRAVCGTNPEYFDLSETFEPHDGSITAAQPGIGDGLQTAPLDIDLPVRFESGQKMPTQRAHQFQVFNRSVPTVETNKLRIEAALESCQQHFGKMIVLSFAIAVFIKYAVINWHTPHTVGPEQSNEIDAGDDGFLLLPDQCR